MTARLKTLRMKNWRSIADAELSLVDGAPTLLYGENDAGKSNVIAAVETFYKLLAFVKDSSADPTGESFDWVEFNPHQIPPEGAIALEHPIHYKETSAILEGVLSSEQGEQTTVSFEISTERRNPDSDDARFVLKVLKVAGPFLFHPPRALRLGERRGFQAELLPAPRAPELALAPDGGGVKLALFRCANSAHKAMRERYYGEFRELVKASPAHLPEPVVVVGDDSDIRIHLGDAPVEHHGAGVQQWVLAAAMVAVDAPDIVLFEEPETNLSWESQRAIVGLLQALARRRQLVIATHSPHLGSLAGKDGPWIFVRRDGGSGPTQLEQRRGEDEVWRAYSRSEGVPLVADKRRLILFPGNLLRLHEEAVEHLGIRPGDAVVTDNVEDGELRILRVQSAKRWLGIDDDEQ